MIEVLRCTVNNKPVEVGIDPGSPWPTCCESGWASPA